MRMVLSLEENLIPSLSKSLLKRVSPNSIMFKYMKKTHIDYMFPRTLFFWEIIKENIELPEEKFFEKIKDIQTDVNYIDTKEFFERKIRGFLKNEFNIPKDAYKINKIEIGKADEKTRQEIEILIGHFEANGEVVVYEYLPKRTLISVELEPTQEIDFKQVEGSVFYIGLQKKTFNFGKIMVVKVSES